MARDGDDERAAATVTARLTFLADAGEKPVSYTAEIGEGPTRRTGRYREHAVAVGDGRAVLDDLDLDREGFVLARHETRVEDFYDRDAFPAVYDGEVARLVKKVSGARRVVVFDHTLRADSAARREEKKVREPVRVVHNDYTERSGPQRVRDLLPRAEAEALLAGRFAIINVWRPIGGPVRTAPLAVCDAQSIAPADLVAAERRSKDRIGEIQHLVFNPGQRWFYFPNMEPNEALLIKCYDSAADGRARFTAHAAFDDATAPPDAAPRESIETRTFAFF